MRPTTFEVHRWELTHHLLPHFASRRVDEITVEHVDAYRRAKVREGTLGAAGLKGQRGVLASLARR